MTGVIIQAGIRGPTTLSLRSGDLQANFNFQDLTNSIVDMLAAFDRQLYYGYMHRDVFLYGHYLNYKEVMMQQMLQDADLTAQYHRHLAFFMYMARIAQDQKKWRYPGLLNRHPNGRIEQMTGRNRAAASLLVHERPWEQFPILLAEHPDFQASELLKDPELVQDDERLQEILQVDPDGQKWSASVELNLVVEKTGPDLWCRLDYVGTGYFHDVDPKQGLAMLEEFNQWRTRYPGPVPLAVYTQWPELLIDRPGVFDIEIVGSSEGMLMDKRPGTAEHAVRRYHNSPSHSQDHVLWVIGPRFLDLTDFLFWLDTQHSTYISSDWQFILYRRQPQYVNTFVSLSQAAF